MALVASTGVSPDSRAPQWARAWCLQQLTIAWVGPDPVTPQLLQDVSLVVSELVTNAVRAGCNRLTVRLSIDRDRMRLAVVDDGAGTPVRQQLRLDATSGRGLAIVSALSSDWGVRRLETGKEVWADLAISVS